MRISIFNRLASNTYLFLELGLCCWIARKTNVGLVNWIPLHRHCSNFFVLFVMQSTMLLLVNSLRAPMIKGCFNLQISATILSFKFVLTRWKQNKTDREELQVRKNEGKKFILNNEHNIKREGNNNYNTLMNYSQVKNENLLIK